MEGSKSWVIDKECVPYFEVAIGVFRNVFPDRCRRIISTYRGIKKAHPIKE